MFVLDHVARKSAMNALLCTPTHARRRPPLLERLVNLVVGIGATGGEGFDVRIAQAVEEAFASIAREYRR